MDKNCFSLISGLENKEYVVSFIQGQNKFKRRLLDLGFVNTNVKIIRKSSFKGVYLLELRGAVLALKKKEVASIFVKNIKKTEWGEQ